MIEVARVHELGDDTVDRPVELLQVAGRARQLGDPVQGLLHLGGLRALGFDGLELCQPAARLGELGRDVGGGIHPASISRLGMTEVSRGAEEPSRHALDHGRQ